MSMQGFKFIVSDGPQIRDDPEVRTVIRKQAAMEGVAAARRKRGAYGSINSIQYRSHDSSTGALKGTVSKQSASLVSATSSRSTSTTHITASKGVVRFYYPTTSLALVEQHEIWLPSSIANPIGGYEASRAEYRFDIMDLCPMTGFHIGQSTMSAMVRDSTLLGTVLRKQVDSYLSFIPSRYGHKPYLTAVVDSVIAKARGTLYTHNLGYSAVVMRTYGNALRAVQEAMDDEEASRDADLLCAVQMLSLHEILEPERTSAYAHHIQGTASLIRHRSPSSFTTLYEQTLFLAHIGPAFYEAIYRGEPCYLAQPEWMRLYASLAQDTPDLTERSPVIIRIRKAFLYTPGMFLDTSRALSPEAQYDPGSILTLELKILAIHHDLLNCLKDYKTYMVRAPESALGVGSGTYEDILGCLCVYKRMLAALCEADRPRLETECQTLVTLSLQAHEQSSAKHSWLHKELTHSLVLILQHTRPSWEEDLTGWSAPDRTVASRKRWETFRGHTINLRL